MPRYRAALLPPRSCGQPKYRAALQDRLQQLNALLDEPAGVKALAIADVKDRLQAWTAEMSKPLAPTLDTAVLRSVYYQACLIHEAIALAGRVRSMRLAVEDHQAMFNERYLSDSESPRARIVTITAAMCRQFTPHIYTVSLASHSVRWWVIGGAMMAVVANKRTLPSCGINRCFQEGVSLVGNLPRPRPSTVWSEIAFDAMR